MIYVERTIVIKKNEAKIEEPIVLYKGDMDIELQFIIENNPFKYKAGTAITYGQLVIKRPTSAPIFSEPAKLSNNRVLFTVTGDMIDELTELGSYDFQIRLINTDMTSRGTLPPVTEGIIIKEPICEEAMVNFAQINDDNAYIMSGNNVATYSMRKTDDIFTNDGDYNRTNWFGGDIITDTKLNKIEEALYQINDNIPTDYATEEFVEDAVKRIEQLGYAEESYVDYAIASNSQYLEEYMSSNYVNKESMSNYATKEYAEDYADSAVARINLDNYTTYDYVDREIKKLDINKYATQEYVDDAVSNVEGGNVDLTGYVTDDELETALDNRVTYGDLETTINIMMDRSDYVTKHDVRSMIENSVPNIMTIGNGPDYDQYVFTGNEFSDEDYNNGSKYTVLLDYVRIGYIEFNDLAHFQLSMSTLPDDHPAYSKYPDIYRCFSFTTMTGAIYFYIILPGGILELLDSEEVATTQYVGEALGKYATQGYVNEQIGDINAILDSINGEEI